MKTKQNILARLFLLLLFTINISASDTDSRRFESYNAAMICAISVLIMVVAMQEQVIKKIGKKHADDQKKSQQDNVSEKENRCDLESSCDAQDSSHDVQELIHNTDTMIYAAVITLGALLLQPTFLVCKDIYQFYSPSPQKQLDDLIAQEKLHYVAQEHEAKALAIREQLNCIKNSDVSKK